MIPEPASVVLQVVGALEELGIPYHLGGSFASSLHGVPRQTHDLDVVVDLSDDQVQDLVSRLAEEFYVEPEMIRSAIQRRGSFNLVHLASGFKIDLFVVGTGPFDHSEFGRRHPQRLLEDLPREVMVKSAEDTVLRKLQWYESGGGVSDRQWSDVLGVLRVQGNRLDLEYLRRWAGELGVADLLERALAAARG